MVAKKKPYNNDRKQRMCDPGMCDSCEYIGEGDFICNRFHDDNGNPGIFVVEKWEPNKNYMMCKKVKRNGYK